MEALQFPPSTPRPAGTPASKPPVEDRRRLLADRIERYLDDPDALATVVSTGLADGLACDLDEATTALLASDPDRDRALQLRAQVLIATMRIDDAVALLEPVVDAPDASADLLALAARVAARIGDDDAVERYLDRALVDGDHVDALEHLLDRRAAGGGDAAIDVALSRWATRPGARTVSRTKLAARVLAHGDEVAACEAYRRVIAASLDDTDAASVYAVIVRDLVAAERADLLVDLLGPVYEPDRHGVAVGLHLLDAYIAIGARDDGIALLDRLTRVELVPDRVRIDDLRRRLTD